MTELRLLAGNNDNFDYELVKEGHDTLSPKYLLKGVLQKADTLNQNGRIYPLAILEREVRNYQKFIVENRALGELDHPECVPGTTEIFTSSGWKKISDILEDEVVATLNVDTNVIEYQQISKKIDQHYKGTMYSFKNARSFDMLLTPSHRVLVWDRLGKPYFVTAEEAYIANKDKDSAFSHSCLKRSGTWFGENSLTIEVAGKQIATTLWAAFLGIYLAEGHAAGVLSGKMKTRKSQQTVVVTQKKAETREIIGHMMSFLPWDVKEIAQGFVITDKELYEHLFVLGDSHTKHVPEYVKSWSPALLGILLDWMLLGDGRNRRSGHKSAGAIISEYCTTSPVLADNVYEIMLKLGFGATVHVYDQTDRCSPDYKTTGRMILAKNSKPMHIVCQHSSVGMSLDHRFMLAEKVDYDDRVYCVVVPNGTWLMRYNDKVCWTGNSSIVNLKNVSHIVREAHIENGTVAGTVEILNTPSGKTLQSLIDSKVKLGISSRGVGSTRKQNDYHVVQDDFQLICWDVVSEPSTPGAFLIPEGKIISLQELHKVFNRSDRIDRVLNDILSYK